MERIARIITRCSDKRAEHARATKVGKPRRGFRRRGGRRLAGRWHSSPLRAPIDALRGITEPAARLPYLAAREPAARLPDQLWFCGAASHTNQPVGESKKQLTVGNRDR